MIKNFETYINEDYFSKLANRKDNGDVRKENENDIVMSCFDHDFEKVLRGISIRYENGKKIVDVDGSFYLKLDIKKIPFQFGAVTDNFCCSGCMLETLEGCPEKVGGIFTCTYCESLTSLEGCPKEVGEKFLCNGCGKKFTEEEVKSLCNVKGNITV